MRDTLKKALSGCNVDAVKNVFPILKWLPKYNLKMLKADIIASLAVGMMVIPQSLALASLAELPAEAGLYTSFPAGFVYCLLGTAKDVTIGPTVVAAMVTNRYNMEGNTLTASSLAFITGIILVALGIFKLGFVVQFIPSPVVGGFVSAAAVIIAVGQLKYIFGLKNAPRFFFYRVAHFFKNIKDTNPWDVTLGLICLVTLIFLQILSKGKWRTKKPGSVMMRIFKTSVIFLIVARSAIIVVLATLVSYLFHSHGYTDSFTLAGHLPPGLPKPNVPIAKVKITSPSGNTTHLSELDVISSFGTGIAVVPLILFIESVAVAKALARKNKYSVDATQELIALGVCNLFGSFFGAFPMTGSFSRSAVNSMSGVATPLAGVFTSVLVVLAIQFITPLFRYIPMAALGAMVFAAVITMIECSLPRKVFRVYKLDLLVVVVSFFGCFYEIEMGILAGSAVGIILILYRVIRPRIDEIYDQEQGVVTLTINGGMWYPGVNSLAESITSAFATSGGAKTVVVDFQHVFEIDFTVAQSLRQALIDAHILGGEIEFVNVNSANVLRVLRRTGAIKGGDEDEVESCDTHSLIHPDKVSRCLLETTV